MYKYKPRTDELDSRSAFANYACDLLVAKHNRQLTETLKEVGLLREYFEEHVRNIYERCDDEIPLFGLYELMKYGKDNWGFTDEEYKDAKQTALITCNQYHNFDLASVLTWEKANL